MWKPSVRATNPKTGDFTFHDHEVYGARLADAVSRRLKFPNDIREPAVGLVRHHLVVIIRHGRMPRFAGG